MPELDRLVHQPARLRIMSALVALAAGKRIAFPQLRDRLELTDGNLGAHLRKLEAASYVELEKSFIDGKPRTSVGATASGRLAFVRHLAALEEIIAGS